MKIDLLDIEKEGLDLDITQPFKEPLTEGPVVAHLHIDKKVDDLYISGSIRGKLRLRCSRCLREFVRDVEIDVDLHYLPLEKINRVENYEIKPDEIDIGYYRDHEIDITEVIQEQLYLTIPMKPLCNELCKGLCPHCGADLNIQECKCRVSRIDPRLAVLKELLVGKEN